MIFDVSEANGGEPFDTLSDALSYADSVLLAGQKKGGMTIKYVQSSDNKYVQFRCIADEFTTDTTQWQGVDVTPKPASKNFLESGGAFDELSLEIGDSAEYNNVAPDTVYPFHFIAGESYIIKNTGNVNKY